MTTMDDVRETVISLKEQVKTLFERVSSIEVKLKENDNSMNKFAITVNDLTNKLDTTNKSVDKLLEKLEKLDNEPNEFNKNIKYCAATVIVTTLINQVVTFLFK